MIESTSSTTMIPPTIVNFYQKGKQQDILCSQHGDLQAQVSFVVDNEALTDIANSLFRPI